MCLCACAAAEVLFSDHCSFVAQKSGVGYGLAVSLESNNCNCQHGGVPDVLLMLLSFIVTRW